MNAKPDETQDIRTAFAEAIQAIRTADTERGYSLEEMCVIERQVIRRDEEWQRYFDEYLTSLVSYSSDSESAGLVRRAAALADARQEFLLQRKDDL